MENKKQKRTTYRAGGKGRFTAVDTVLLILVVVLLVGTVAGWVWQTVVADEATEEGITYAVSFRIASTHRQVTEGLSVGDRLYSTSGEFIGYLRDDLAVYDDSEAELANRVTGTGSMVCVGHMDGRSLRVGDVERYITPGDTLKIHTEREILTVYILKISEVSAQG